MSITDFIQVSKRCSRLILSCSFILALIIAFYSYTFVENQYQVETTLQVSYLTESSVDILHNELNASQMLANDVAKLATSSRVINDVKDRLDIDDISDYEVNVNSSERSRVMTISVTGHSPTGVADVCNQVVSSLSDISEEVFGFKVITLIDNAEVPTSACGPNRPLMIVSSFIAAAFSLNTACYLYYFYSLKINRFNRVDFLPVLGSVPHV